jgi:hypothetical protein
MPEAFTPLPALAALARGASSARFDRLPSRHAPSDVIPAFLIDEIARNELAPEESLCSASGDPSACCAGRLLVCRSRAVTNL